ncbi:hypothetical protein [Rugosimonospora acidiphila]|uniref:hypothetical protein n=1 Tax=Rugosimonospora acidiphila TaxID=556531 RepID=UPI0031EA874D
MRGTEVRSAADGYAAAGRLAAAGAMMGAVAVSGARCALHWSAPSRGPVASATVV